jgi:membrane protein implicated in regulation of membrane protease activity
VNNFIVWFWAALAIVFFVAEVFTMGFFLVCFGIGAVAAALLAVLGVGVIWQLVVFIGVSLVALAFLRPLAVRMTTHVANPGGVDRVIGKQAVVLEEIDPHAATGRVRIEREEWRADTYGPAIPKGALVVVIEVTGTRVIVVPVSAVTQDAVPVTATAAITGPATGEASREDSVTDAVTGSVPNSRENSEENSNV